MSFLQRSSRPLLPVRPPEFVGDDCSAAPHRPPDSNRRVLGGLALHLGVDLTAKQNDDGRQPLVATINRVNNAARQISHDSLADITTENFDDTFKTNVYAMFWITKAALPHLKAGASIINTASVNAYEPSENIIDYAATKGAIMIFTKGLAKQLASKGIRVNAIAPGPVWTALHVTGGQPTSKLPSFGKDTPLGRAGQPAELSPLYVLLASDESSYSTGQVFAAVGGKGGLTARGVRTIVLWMAGTTLLFRA